LVFFEKKMSCIYWYSHYVLDVLTKELILTVGEKSIVEMIAEYMDGPQLIQTIQVPSNGYSKIYNNLIYHLLYQFEFAVYDLEGHLINRFGSHGYDDGQFQRVSYFQVYRNKLYVADAGQHRIQILDTNNNRTVGSIGQYGNGLGDFDEPTYFDFCDHKIIVISHHGTKIQVFDIDTFDFLYQCGVQEFNTYNSVAVIQNVICVFETTISTIHKFDSTDGKLLTIIYCGTPLDEYHCCTLHNYNYQCMLVNFNKKTIRIRNQSYKYEMIYQIPRFISHITIHKERIYGFSSENYISVFQ